jgi:hypothetical protein
VYADYAKMFVGRANCNSFRRSRDSQQAGRTQGLDDRPSCRSLRRPNAVDWHGIPAQPMACKMELKDGSRSIMSHDSGTGRIIGDPESLELVIVT